MNQSICSSIVKQFSVSRKLRPLAVSEKTVEGVIAMATMIGKSITVNLADIIYLHFNITNTTIHITYGCYERTLKTDLSYGYWSCLPMVAETFR